MNHLVAYEGLVVDVITNETHPKYSSDGFNFGMINVRFLREQNTSGDDQLYFAHPFDLGHLELPFIGEVVHVYKILGKFYYTKKVSLTKALNHSALIGQNELEKSKSNSDDGGPGGEFQFTKTKKEKFLPDNKVWSLRPFPGDYIIQGRLGHSIRFGSSLQEKDSKTLNPSLLFRVGQNPDAEKTVNTDYGLILEDINKDAASIWMITDQKVPFEPATKDGPAHLISSFDTKIPNNGSQIYINADAVFINSKKNSIYLFSATDVHLNSLNNIALDSGKKIYITGQDDVNLQSGISMLLFANKDITINGINTVNIQGDGGVKIVGASVFVGNEDKTEPLVCGQKLSDWLDGVLEILLNPPLHSLGMFMTPVVWKPNVIAKLQQKKALLAVPTPSHAFNSADNYVGHVNKVTPLSS